MTVEFFDLAQRLYARQAGRPVLRMAQSLFTVAADAVCVDAHRDGDTVVATVCGSGSSSRTIRGGAAVLAALHTAGARFGGDTPCQLIIADPSTLAVLVGAARTLCGDGDPAVAEASAVVGWWQDRTGYPGTGAVVELLAHSRQRYITAGTPDDERTVAHWRRTLGIGSGVQGLGAWAAAVGVGERLASLEPVIEDDAYTYGMAGASFAKGGDWTKPDSAPGAALGLRRRCNAAELWESVLLEDRLWRHRGVHTGHVAGGVTVGRDSTRFMVACERMDSRLREGASVRGWINGVDSFDRAWPFVGEVTATEAVDGTLHLTVAGVRAEAQPRDGEWVTLMPAAPQPQRVNSALYSYRRLLMRSDSWIASGRTPSMSRRDVPLDVLIAAAERE
ncbi:MULTISPECIES: hypothetical protein [Mycobacteriaceae]|uniref:hypothetical protein n=1 Tax=Mycobacteriaceae TaxID=1762 RepID=UPI000A0498DF|nr:MULTISPECIES: hypothetical protein [Mycobacteriaceae]MBU8840166.1 hypothetical protein [Mycolicibacterium goodii]UCN12537.1 hypothetical protein LFT50_29000 [Mycobacterium intracellulare subsp. chimaera]